MASLLDLLDYFRGNVGEIITGVDDLDWSSGTLPVSDTGYGFPGNPAAVIPSDETVVSSPKGLWVGGAGDVIVLGAEGDTPVTFTVTVPGTVVPVNAKRVMAATTATNIVALA
jgi:hypothetical protein